MLKNASPNEVDDEEENIANMEDTCKEMGPLIEKKILETERRKDDLGRFTMSFRNKCGFVLCLLTSIE